MILKNQIKLYTTIITIIWHRILLNYHHTNTLSAPRKINKKRKNKKKPKFKNMMYV